MDNWFGHRLKSWYLINKRDLPWRKTRDPFKIWLSEIILQQTQVAQGLSYYNKFTTRYKSASQLAQAPEDEVLKLWQGLGYYSRARNLLSAAKQIQQQFNGVFPDTYEKIRSLKGVGDYSAAAIGSFAFDLPHAVLDGNVYRLLSRLYGIRFPIDNSAGKKYFSALATELLDKKDPALHNQAIMEFGSQYCRPARPNCSQCIFVDKCVASQTGTVEQLPLKSKKTRVRQRHFNYLLLVDKKKNVLLNKRQQKDIWKGLYEFTLVESEKEMDALQLMELKEVQQVCEPGSGIKYVSPSYRHVLTHQHLHAKFYVVTLNKKTHEKQSTSCPVSGLQSYAFPRLIEKFLEDCDLKEIV
jgi:A/G-specific adenine glycosylase